MFRSSDVAGEALALDYEWSMRRTPPHHILHVCGPAYAGTCLPRDEGAVRLAHCERCGAQITYAALARLIRRAEGPSS